MSSAAKEPEKHEPALVDEQEILIAARHDCVDTANTDVISRASFDDNCNEQPVLNRRRFYPTPGLLVGPTEKSASSSARPTFATVTQSSPNLATMDKKLRQNKPRLLLMGQRRYENVLPCNMGENANQL